MAARTAWSEETGGTEGCSCFACLYGEALLHVAGAAQAHLNAADGLSLEAADDEARNREVEAAADLSNALFRLNGIPQEAR